MKQWYVIKTYAGHEKKAKTNIEKMAESRGLTSRIGQISVPTIKMAEMKGGKKRIVEKKFMPGYVIAELDLDDNVVAMIRRLPSISGFVGNPDPQPLTVDEVRNLLNVQSREEEESTATSILFRVGETVKIIDGPFANFTGVVDEIMPEKGRLRVRVEIFGQATPVELDYLQVASNVG